MMRDATKEPGLRAWWPVTMMFACSLLSYLDRQTLAVLSPMILSELHLNAQKYAEIISAFSIAYMIASPVWGTILDRIGLRRGMALAVTIWTIACGAHAILAGFMGFAVARAVLGFGEGATFPGGLRTTMDSLPPDKQARGMAVAYSGGSLGAMITPILVTPVALRYGWRAAFIVTGVAGLLWVGVWLTAVDFENDISSKLSERIVLPNLFERRFWTIVAGYALGALPLGVILYLAPLYLSRVLGFTQAQLGMVLWIPPLGWEAGYFFWGWFTDRTASGEARPVWLFVMLAAFSVPLAAVPLFRSAAIAMALMFWEMFAAAGYVVATLRTGALAYPPEQTAMVAGIAVGSWSAMVAIFLPTLGHMFDVGHYANAFLFVSLVPVVGTICWWGFSAPSASDVTRE